MQRNKPRCHGFRARLLAILNAPFGVGTKENRWSPSALAAANPDRFAYHCASRAASAARSPPEHQVCHALCRARLGR